MMISLIRRVVALGADEGSVNLGKKGGVAALTRKDIPRLAGLHCLPHRRELALLKVQKTFKSVEEVHGMLMVSDWGQLRSCGVEKFTRFESSCK